MLLKSSEKTAKARVISATAHQSHLTQVPLLPLNSPSQVCEEVRGSLSPAIVLAAVRESQTSPLGLPVPEIIPNKGPTMFVLKQLCRTSYRFCHLLKATGTEEDLTICGF